MKNNSVWMVISGTLGLSFFLIANLTTIFVGLNVTAGVVQIILNAFVFVTWLRGYRTSNGFKRFVAFFGVVVPVVMASITIYRVLVPFFL